ncbi:MAG: hypothetical protein F7C37_04915 [Desulfurococcales archaeon]|nr:hypothetical protein [Desulfurococcales archaeon]
MRDREIALIYTLIIMIVYILTFTILRETSSMTSYATYSLFGIISYIIASIIIGKVIEND